MRELTDQEWELEMVSHAIGSPSGIIYIKESVNEVLAVLSDKEKEILILAAAGFDNHQIALYLNFKTNKIVATRLGQIQQKVKTKIEILNKDSKINEIARMLSGEEISPEAISASKKLLTEK
jgi:DNA-binding NarL/FixJ family response regulator